MAMSESRMSDVKMKVLLCPLCNRVFTSPRLLPCCHTLCQSCLRYLASTGKRAGLSFPCPVCRRQTAVPPGGPQKFKTNIYISNEDLEAAIATERSRKKRTVYRVLHTGNVCMDRFTDSLWMPLISSGLDGDQTSGPVDVAVQELTEQLINATQQLNTVRLGSLFLKDQINAQHRYLLQRGRDLRDKILKELDRVSKVKDKQVESDIEAVRRKVFSIHDWVSFVEETDPVALISTAHHILSQAFRFTRFSNVTTRHGRKHGVTASYEINCDVTRISDDTFASFMGSVVLRPCGEHRAARTEGLTALFRCGDGGECREVHALCRGGHSHDAINVSFGGTGPKHVCELLVTVNRQGLVLCRRRASDLVDIAAIVDTGMQSFFRRHRKRLDRSEFKVPAVNPVTAEAETRAIERKREVMTWQEVKEVAMPPDAREKADTVVAFSADSTGSMFAAIEEEYPFVVKKPSFQSFERTVVLHHRQKTWKRCAVYYPIDPNFFPSDLCFWKDESRAEKLLIADWSNDAVHVVRVHRRVSRVSNCLPRCDFSMIFERFLAPGSACLVKPSALDCGMDNELLIGCSNGWVLNYHRTSNSGNEEEDAAAATAAVATAAGETHLRDCYSLISS